MVNIMNLGSTLMQDDITETVTAPETETVDITRMDESMIKNEVIEVLRTIYDPEIPVDIYSLGLIYNVDVDDQGHVEIEMTLTSPACPVAGSLPPEVEYKVSTIDGVSDVVVHLVWEPTWTPDRMSEAAKLELGFF